MSFNKSFLKHMMTRDGLTVDSLRDRLREVNEDTSTAAIRSWLYRDTEPSFSKAIALAKVFGVKTDDFANK